MIRTIRSVGAAVLFGAILAAPAMAQTTTAPKGAMKISAAECASLWNRLDAAKSGSVAQAAAQGHVTDFKAVDANNDGKLSQAEFQAACDKGLVQGSASTGSGAGNPGSDTAPKK